MAERTYGSTFWNLVQSIQDGRAIAFVGAGVSTAVRQTPTWSQCIAQLVSALLVDAGRNSSERSKVLKALEVTANNHPLFAAEQCRKYLQEAFPDRVREILSVRGEENHIAKAGLKAFLNLPFHRVVTTNYDNLLIEVSQECQPERHIDRFTHKDVENFYSFSRFGDSPSRRSIFHIHGHFDDPDSIILTEDQYQEAYLKPSFAELMKEIFATKSAVFIGFSLKDLDVMQIFRRIVAQAPHSRETHFAIVPKDANKSSSALWLDALRNNYEYSVGTLYYDNEDGTHEKLWEVVEDLSRKVQRPGPTEPKGKIAIVVDKGFPYERSLYETVELLNRIQAEIRYDIRRDIDINLSNGFSGFRPPDRAFHLVGEEIKSSGQPCDGVFVITNKRESHRFFFLDRRFESFISTWFWSEHIGPRPSIDEFILHTLVLLTLYYFHQLYNATRVLIPHDPDRGCLFDMTMLLRDRIAVIDYPRVCDESQRQLEQAFQGKEIPLGMDWLRRVIPLVES